MARIEEQLIQKGVRQGIEQGMQKGIEQGVRATLARLLHARFGALSPELEQRIERASAEQLERYIDRVVTASRAEEVFEPVG